MIKPKHQFGRHKLRFYMEKDGFRQVSLTKTDATDEWTHLWLQSQRSVNSWVVGTCGGNLSRAQLHSDTKNMPSHFHSCCQSIVETINMDRVGRKRWKEDLIFLVWYERSSFEFHAPIHKYQASESLKKKKTKYITNRFRGSISSYYIALWSCSGTFPVFTAEQ